MQSFTLIQITDTHLSRQRPAFVRNFEVAADIIARDRPDLVVHTGDIAVEATMRPDDLLFGREAMDSIGVLYRAIPGNHDVGDNPSDNDYMPEKPVTAALVDTYEDSFGPGHWHLDQGGWRLIGLNAQLFCSGLVGEKTQHEWLIQTLAESANRPVAVFCHKPLLRETLIEPVDVPYRYVPLARRAALAEMMDAADVRLFACGHVHQARDHQRGKSRHIWAPATAFTLPDSLQPRIGDKRCGLVSYRFTPDDVAVEMIFPEAMDHPAPEVLKDAYAA